MNSRSKHTLKESFPFGISYKIVLKKLMYKKLIVFWLRTKLSIILYMSDENQLALSSLD